MKRIFTATAIAAITCAGIAAAPRTAEAQGPSFDCARAGTPAEHAICASPELSQKDQVISALYTDLRRALGERAKERLIPEQRAWIAERNACGGNSACIAATSDMRINQLEFRSREVF
ncbi:MAG: lysozyme inhibitor LprI family protein [Sulfitobacter sp.]